MTGNNRGLNEPHQSFGKPFLTLKEFSQTTGLSQSTIRRRVKDGSIKVIQLGGKRCRILFPIQALEQASQPDLSKSKSLEPTPKSRPKSGPKPGWLRD